ncbi:Replication protein [uncultured Microcoleus sp.]|uniref:Replication protein n=1 Tax=uncultured Microcoleus sp. TaxID=259945 RepID=A0A6J4MW88_9CYAN|nr:Replication protein [uncultured Microcoleus sp.]
MPASNESKGGDSWFLAEISPADQSWDAHRAQSDEIAKLYELCGYERYAERISQCSEWLMYALKSNDEGEIRLKLRDARFCRVRHCVVCQWRRSLMWRARFFKALPEIQAKYPTGRWIFVTLTVKNCELSELKKTLTWMNTAWKRFLGRKEFPALGFIKSVEVTRGWDGTAHPHFHCLMLVPAGYFSKGYIAQAEWTSLWQSCLKVDYTPIVNVKTVKGKKGTLNATGEASKEAMARAVCETLKYSVKPDDLLADPEWLGELTKQLQKTRAISIGGCLKEFFSEDEPEDLINADIEEEEKTEDEAMLFFDWASAIRRYKKGSGRKSS